MIIYLHLTGLFSNFIWHIINKYTDFLFKSIYLNSANVLNVPLAIFDSIHLLSHLLSHLSSHLLSHLLRSFTSLTNTSDM